VHLLFFHFPAHSQSIKSKVKEKSGSSTHRSEGAEVVEEILVDTSVGGEDMVGVTVGYCVGEAVGSSHRPHDPAQKFFRGIWLKSFSHLFFLKIVRHPIFLLELLFVARNFLTFSHFSFLFLQVLQQYSLINFPSSGKLHRNRVFFYILAFRIPDICWEAFVLSFTCWFPAPSAESAARLGARFASYFDAADGFFPFFGNVFAIECVGSFTFFLQLSVDHLLDSICLMYERTAQEKNNSHGD